MEGAIDFYYASLTSQEVQHRVFYPDGTSSRYQPCPTGLNFGEQTEIGVFPLVITVLLLHRGKLLTAVISGKNGVLKCIDHV